MRVYVVESFVCVCVCVCVICEGESEDGRVHIISGLVLSSRVCTPGIAGVVELIACTLSPNS